MVNALHRLRWIAPVAVLTIAVLLRLWALDRPGTLVFDELYYVRDAVSQLAHGFTTTWPDDDPTFGGERATLFSSDPNAIAHPPLGKWLIGLGILMFGPDSGWGWRFSVALFGVIAVAITMRLGWLMTRSMWIASLAGLLLAVDGVHVVLSRVAILDGFLTTLVVLGALFVWKDQERWIPRRLWNRPWLFAAGAAFGAAAAVKWSGLYPLAAFLIAISLRDWWLRRRIGLRHPFWSATWRAAIIGPVTIGIASVTYVASWIGWIINPGGQNRVEGEPWWVSLTQWHADAWAWHSTLSAPHPFASSPLTWPLALRPTSMYKANWNEGCHWAEGCVSTVTPIPNPLVTWAGVIALILLIVVLARAVFAAVRSRRARRSLGSHVAGVHSVSLAHPAAWVASFVLLGYLSGWLPWVLTLSRSAVFQFYAVVFTPFAALALALVLGSIASFPSRAGNFLELAGFTLRRSSTAVQGRRIAVALFILFALLLAILFFPMWSGIPMTEWFWRAHLWLPSWS